APSPLPAWPWRRSLQPAILDECSRVAEVRDVLARRALPGLAPARHRFGPRRIERLGVTLVRLGEIGALVIQIGVRRTLRIRQLDVTWLNEDERMSLGDR